MAILNLPVTVCYLDGSGSQHIRKGVAFSSRGALDILDQTRLPESVVRMHLATPQEVFDAIKRLCVRGAPAIGCASAVGLAVCAARFEETNDAAFRDRLRKTAAFLKSARPTAVNLMWAVDRCCAAVAGLSRPADICQRLLDEALDIIEEDSRLCRRIGDFGAELLKDGMTVLTHCNAGALATCGMGTALAPVYRAMEQGKRIRVYSDEARASSQAVSRAPWRSGRVSSE